MTTHFDAEIPAAPPAPRGAVDRLAAAILETDPSAVVLDQSAGFRIKIGEPGADDAVAVLLETSADPPAEALARLRTQVMDAVASVRSGQFLHLVVADSRGLGVGSMLREIVPRSLLGLQRHAHVWTAGGNLETVRGLQSVVLSRAAQRAGAGAPANLEATAAGRAEEAREAQQFLAALQGRRAVVTWTVAVSNLAIFGLQFLWGGGEAHVAASRMGGSTPAIVSSGEIWRLFSSMMLHANPMHVALNMLALFSFGTFLEKFLGWRRFLILYVLSGLGGSLLSLLQPKPLSVGASGGIWGLMVAGAVLVTWSRQRLPALVSASQRRRAWTPVAINALYSFSPGIDWLAHLGGGLTGGLLVLTGWLTAGFALAGVPRDETRPPSREGALVRALAAMSGAALVISVGLAWLNGRPWELQSGPRMQRVELSGAPATVELPHFDGPTTADANKHLWRFGGLNFDPAAVVIAVQATSIDEATLAGLREWLGAIGQQLNADPVTMEGFTMTTPFELKEREGRPYLVSRQSAADGRYADSYYLVAGRVPANVLVILSPKASASWKDAAGRIPFSLSVSP